MPSRLARLSLAVLVLCVAGAAGGSGAAEAKKSPRLNAYFATDFTDAAYQRAAFDRVLKAWKVAQPLPDAGKKAVVIATIGRDGALLDARFHLNSGQKPFDDGALAAVKAAAPFAPFPKAYARPTVEVHWHFSVEPVR